MIFFHIKQVKDPEKVSKRKKVPIKKMGEPFSTGTFFLIPENILCGENCLGWGNFWDQEKGSRGKRFPYYFNWEPFSFLIEIFYNSPNKFEKHQCEHIIRGFGFIMYHYAVHMCL